MRIYADVKEFKIEPPTFGIQELSEFFSEAPQSADYRIKIESPEHINEVFVSYTDGDTWVIFTEDMSFCQTTDSDDCWSVAKALIKLNEGEDIRANMVELCIITVRLEVNGYRKR